MVALNSVIKVQFSEEDRERTDKLIAVLERLCAVKEKELSSKGGIEWVKDSLESQ